MANGDDIMGIFGTRAPSARPAPAAAGLIKGAALAGPNAVLIDAWTRRKGAELFKESPRIQRALIGKGGAEAAADMFGLAFEPEPSPAASCSDPARLAYVKELLASPAYKTLHEGTNGDELASEMAACELADGLAKAKKELDKPAPAGEGPARAAAREAAAKARCKAIAAGALSKAKKEADSAGEAMKALGCGPADATHDTMEPDALAALVRQAVGSEELRRVFDMAGAFRRVARARQKSKASHGLDEFVGVRMGDDIPHLLPHELAALDDPDLGDDALARLCEKRMLCWETRAVEKVARGPVIVCVDESGSMRGPNAESAKALALAMAWVARSQNRWCALVAYSGDSGERVLALPPGRTDPKGIVEWVRPFIGGGSALDVPVREMPRIYKALGAPAGRTDLVFITDARLYMPAGVAADFLAWKKAAGCKLFSLVIENAPGELEAISDECHTVPPLSAGLDAVGSVLSI